MIEDWELDARTPDEYHFVEAERGREFIIRLTTGADVFTAIQKFAIDQKIEFAKVHACFMGGLQPTKYLKWVPDTTDPGNWHREDVATVANLSMICTMSGIIHPRQGPAGKPEPFPAIHFVAGGAWDCPIFGGHLEQGSLVKGVLECFITEIKGIENLAPKTRVYKDNEYPENWYQTLK